jgi:hypothetical protein
MGAHRGTHPTRHEAQMIKVLRAITGDANHQADRVYRIAVAAANGIGTELYKAIEVLRADLHYWRRRWW